MVNAPNMNLLPLPAGKYGKLTKKSTQWRHQGNQGNSGLESERVRVLGALRSFRSRKTLSAERRRKTHFSSSEEKEKWIKDHVDSETAVARQRVQDAETAIMKEWEHMTNEEKGRLTTTKSETMFDQMLNAIGLTLSDLASSDDEVDEEDEDDDGEDTALGKLSEDNEPGWVMGTIFKTVQHRMGSFGQKQMRLDELTQPG